MELALILGLLGFVVLTTMGIVILFLRAPEKALRLGDWLKLTNNILVLSLAGVLLAGSVFALVVEWDDPMGAGIYLFIGGLIFAFAVLNMGSRHLGGLNTFGSNDLPSRIGRMFRQTGQLWRDLVRNRSPGGPGTG